MKPNWYQFDLENSVLISINQISQEDTLKAKKIKGNF